MIHIFECTICDRIFKRKGSCIRHIKNAHEEALLTTQAEVLVQDVVPTRDFHFLILPIHFFRSYEKIMKI